MHALRLTPEEIIIAKKAMFHKHCKVHITFKKGFWENGIIEDVGEDYLNLKFLTEQGKKRWGMDSKIFFFAEIGDIEEYLDEGQTKGV